MAVEALVIAISATGAVVVQRSIAAIGAAARSAEQPVLSFNRAVGAIAAGGAVYRLGQILNTYQQLENQLTTVTSSTRELTEVQNRLYQISQQTRSSYSDNVRIFSRVARSLQEVGASSAEALRITETLNKAMQIGGATGQERTSVLIQLTQAMSSGRLQGDELRSVLENSTILGRYLAQTMGVTRGELRELGREGKITVDVLIDMFRRYGVAIDEEFKKTKPTIEQGWMLFRNSAEQAIVALDKQFKISEGIAGFFTMLSDNMNTITRLAPVMGAALVAAFTAANAAGTGLAGTIGRVISMLLFNPFTAWVTGLAAVGFALYQYSDDIKISSDSQTALSDVANVVWDDLRNGWDQLNSDVQPKLKTYADTIKKFLNPNGFDQKMPETGNEWITSMAKGADNILNGFEAMFKSLGVMFTAFPQVLASSVRSAINQALDVIQSGIDAMTDAYNKFMLKLGLPGLASGPITVGKLPDIQSPDWRSEIDQVWKDAYKHSDVEDYVNKKLNEAEQLAYNRSRSKGGPDGRGINSLGGFGEITKPPPKADEKGAKSLQREFDSMLRKADPVATAMRDLERAELAFSKAVEAGKISMEEKNRLMDLMRQRMQDQLDPIGKINRELEEEARLVGLSNDERRIRIQLQQMEDKLLKQGVVATPDQMGQLEKKVREIEVLKDVGGAIEDSFKAVFTGMENAIMQFVETGKFSFKDFADSVISDIARIVLQTFVTKPLTNFFTNLVGGVFSGLGGGGGAAVGGWGGLSSPTGAIGGVANWGGSPGFATGGSFKVGGSGPTDSKLIQFRATPGELVDVRRPGGASGGKGGGSLVINNYGAQVEEAQQTPDGDWEVTVRSIVREELGGESTNSILNRKYGLKAQKKGRK